MAFNVDNTGGYDCKWVEDPPAELKCLICLCVAREPQQHGNGGCGKVFCENCITEYQKTNNTCPNCRGPLTTFKDAKRQRHINALKVRCDNLDIGCQWVGELGSLEEHLTTCDYTPMPCDNQCENGNEVVKVFRKNLEDHLANKCPRRQYLCPHCKEKGEYQERTTTHLEICPKVQVQCPNAHCPDIIPRCEVVTHRSTCDYETVSCKYAVVGCEERPLRKDLKKHEEDDQLHFQLTKEKFLELKTEVSKSTISPCTFRVTNYLQHKKDNDRCFSEAFYTSHTGYKMCIVVDAHGAGAGEGTHVTVGAHLMKGDNDDSLTWPFTGKVTIVLLNQLEDDNYHMGTITFRADNVASQRVVDGERGEGWSLPQFIPHTDLDYNPDENCQYLKDDTLIFRVQVQEPSTITSEALNQQHKYQQKLDELMGDKSTIDLRYLKLYFIGLSGLGKTTFRKRLTGMLRNLSSASPEERKRCSTFLAECTQVLAVATDSKLDMKVSSNIDEETQLLFQYMYEDRSSTPSIDSNLVDSQTTSTEQSDDRTSDPPIPPTNDLETGATGKATSTPRVNVDEIFTRLRKVVASGKYDKALLGKILLNLIDMGGQPGFLEMLPFLSTGPGMYLVFFAMDKELDQQYEVMYEREEDCITPYKAKYTVQETISQILSAISQHTTCDPTAERWLSDRLKGFDTIQPIATLVGTFKDKVKQKIERVTLHKKLCIEFDKTNKKVLKKQIDGILLECQESAEQHPNTATEPARADLQTAEHHPNTATEPARADLQTAEQHPNTATEPARADLQTAEQHPNTATEPARADLQTAEHHPNTATEPARADLQTAEHHPNTATEPARADLQTAIDRQLANESFRLEVEELMHKEMDNKHKEVGEVLKNFHQIIVNPSKEQTFFAVDNFEGTDDDIDPIREHLNLVFNKHNLKKAKIPIRPAQLLMGIILRKEFEIATIDECLEIGERLGMGKDDVDFTIWYLHHCVGALIYHPDIEDEEDWFKKHIICSPQVVFNSISMLIVKSLLELHSHTADVRFIEQERRDWFEKGQFSLETIECCHSKESTDAVDEGRLIRVDKLVKFLRHVNLLSPIKTKKLRGHKEVVDTKYFMPAVLKCASKEELKDNSTAKESDPAPIFITFERGYVPTGLFCAMITRLVSHGSEGILGVKWELVDSGVKRNIVSFRIDAPQHCVTMVSHVNCYEIRLSRQDDQTDLHDLCTYVLTTVQFILKEINTQVNVKVVFACPCDGHRECNNEKSPANWCELCEGTRTCFRCDKGAVTLTDHQKLWFTKEAELSTDVQLRALPFVQSDRGLSFTWYKSGTRIQGGNELTVEKVTSKHCTGYYKCEVTKDKVPYFSVQHCLKEFAPISITQSPPERQEVGEGQSVSLTVTATGTDPTYQWLKDNKPLTDNDSFQGLDEHELVIGKATTDLSGSYSCRVSNKRSWKVSGSAQLDVITAPEIVYHPEDKTVVVGENNVTMTVIADGSGLEYQWRKHIGHIDKVLEEDEQFHNVNSRELTIKSATSRVLGEYSCEVKNLGGSISSENASLTHVITITQSPPERQEVGEGQSVSLTVTATGTDPTYQWLKDNKPLTDNDSFQGLDEHELVIRKATTDLSGSYSCRVSNKRSWKVSGSAQLDVITAPEIVYHPEDKTVVVGENNVTMTVIADGSGLEYQWRKHNGHIDKVLQEDEQFHNVNSPELTIKSATSRVLGEYSCEVKNLGGSISSEKAQLDVRQPWWKLICKGLAGLAVCLLILLGVYCFTVCKTDLDQPCLQQCCPTVYNYTVGPVSRKIFPKLKLTWIDPNEKPKLYELRNFHSINSHESIDIVQKIAGQDYTRFGTILLNDEDGTILSTKERSQRGDPVPIVREILTKWLQSGTATWLTLVQTLRDSEHNQLANMVESNYRHKVKTSL